MTIHTYMHACSEAHVLTYLGRDEMGLLKCSSDRRGHEDYPHCRFSSAKAAAARKIPTKNKNKNQAMNEMEKDQARIP